MGLRFTGRTARTESGLSLQAKDSDSGDNVAVRISDEVLKDHGLASAKLVGEIKYDAGQRAEGGHVDVRTEDMKNA